MVVSTAINLRARKRLDEAADRHVARLLAFAEREDVRRYVALDATANALTEPDWRRQRR